MDGRVFYLQEQMLKNLRNHWSVIEMAEVVSLSVPHFQKSFKTEVGVSPIAWLHVYYAVRISKVSGRFRKCHLLESIAVKHPSRRIRSEAISSLAALESSDSDRVWQMALADSSAFVKNKAKCEMNS